MLNPDWFFGPCPHGREPFERCDLCGELHDAHAEAYAKWAEGKLVPVAGLFTSKWEQVNDFWERALILDGDKCILVRVFDQPQPSWPEGATHMWVIAGGGSEFFRQEGYAQSLVRAKAAGTARGTEAIREGMGLCLYPEP
jgi:hypothetical protein